MRHLSLSVFLLAMCWVVSCKSDPQRLNGNNDPGKISEVSEHAYRISFNPQPNSSFNYRISNKTVVEIDIDGKEVNNQSLSDASISYKIQKDSSGNFLLHLTYDKIHLESKNGDQESSMDSDNASSTADPIEKMLGLLKDASITVVVNPKGQISSIQGYKELADKIAANVNTPDIASRKLVQQRLDQVVGDGLIKKNVRQLFDLFPDSSIKVGDTWTITSNQKNEMDFKISTTYKLLEIEDGLATIESEGNIRNDKGEANLMGQTVAGELHGKQGGNYTIDIETGMMVESTVKGKVQGTLQLMGRSVPVKIVNEVKIEGKRAGAVR